MEILGLLLLVAGGVLWFVRGQQIRRFRNLKLAHVSSIKDLKALAATVASEIGSGDWRDYVVLSGTVVVDEPLMSPLKEQPCVYYTNAVVREYEETIYEKDKDGNTTSRTQRGSDTISQQQRQIPFQVVDQASDHILVNPEGAALEPVEILNEFRPGDPMGGQISFGGFSLPIGPHRGGNRRTLGYRYRESIVPVGQTVTVLGTVSDRGGNLTVEKPAHGGQTFLISPRTPDALAQAATRNTQIASWSMAGCFGGGAVLLLWALAS